MSVPRQSLRAFLVRAKSVLHAAIKDGSNVTFVIGNESADLDSLTSSLLLSYIRSTAPRPGSSLPPLYIPITNIPAADIRLRPEFLALLPYANLEPTHLITLDDLEQHVSSEKDDGAPRLAPEKTRWLLVDHNALQGSIGESYSSRVFGVIDHHDEENLVIKDTGDEPRIVEKSGSCSSLVTKYCRQAWDALSASGDSDEAATWDAEIAKVALASILIDTGNLKSLTKVTETDKEAVDYLEAKIAAAPNQAEDFNRSSFYKALDQAKHHIDDLRLIEILRKDYKQWSEAGGKIKLGISSVVKSLAWQMDKAAHERGAIAGDREKQNAFLEITSEHAKRHRLDICAIMTTSKSPEGQFQRELFVRTSGALAGEALDRFVEDAGPQLRLEAWQEDLLDESLTMSEDMSPSRAWYQRETAASRKQVGPLLRRAINKT